jgi:hypothetical protein
MNNRNTIGEGRFVRDAKEYKEPEDTDPVPGSNERILLAQAQLQQPIMTDAGPARLGALQGSAAPSPAPAPTQPPANGPTIRPYTGPVPPAANDNTYQRRPATGSPTTRCTKARPLQTADRWCAAVRSACAPEDAAQSAPIPDPSGRLHSASRRAHTEPEWFWSRPSCSPSIVANRRNHN